MANTYSKKLTDKSDLKLAWHWLPEDGKLAYNDNRKVVVGQTLSIPDHQYPDPCYRGMHASEVITDALQFNRGPILCRVEVWGDLKEQGDKVSARHRKVIWMHKFTKAEVKAFCKEMGYGPTDGDWTDLSDAANQDTDQAIAWLESFAAQFGCPGLKPTKKVKVDITPKFEKPELTVEILKGLLSTHIVQGENELKARVKDIYQMDDFDDLIDELGYDDDVCAVDGWRQTKNSFGGTSYKNGFVLANKPSTRRKRK